MEKNKVDLGSKLMGFKDAALAKIQSIDITPEEILRAAIKVPGVRILRGEFLKKELSRFYPEETVNKAIETNPAQAGIDRARIDSIANSAINYETNKVSAISFMAGLPGGAAMAATIPADVAQYFGFLIRAMQKLAYLYGFEEFEFDEEKISDDTMNEMLLFLGTMFGVQSAAVGVKQLAQTTAARVAKTLSQKALTKGTIYPIVKKVATQLGVKMTKQVFAKGVSKVVPVLGGVVSGGLTYVTFRNCMYKLKGSFEGLPIADPDFYRREESAETVVAESNQEEFRG